jgi:hypothetical protein
MDAEYASLRPDATVLGWTIVGGPPRPGTASWLSAAVRPKSPDGAYAGKAAYCGKLVAGMDI